MSEQQQPKENIADETFSMELTGDEIVHLLKAVGTATSLWAKNRRQCPAAISMDTLQSACNKVAHATDPRPHTAPAPDDRYTGTCAMQEKCNDYADFCESIMDKLTEDEDEDPPCPIKCEKRVNPHQSNCTEAVRKAREDVLDLIDGRIEGLRILFNAPKDEKTMTDAELLYAIEEIKIIRNCIEIDQSTKQQAGDQ